MNRAIQTVLLFLSLGGWPAWGQGALVFANRLIAQGVNAPVVYLGPLVPGGPCHEMLAAGPNFLAQLYINGRPATDPVPFREGVLAGSIAPMVVYPEGLPGGTTVSAQMYAWYAPNGETLQESYLVHGPGASIPLSVTLAAVPSLPTPMVGLQPFVIMNCIPEPSGGLLLLAGLLGFLCRRR